jgi:pantetheine-phosphate adenylyltransferase
MRRAVFAGSFDPPTIGHRETLRRAARLFDEVILACGHNPLKKGFFDREERRTMLNLIAADFPNVVVDEIVDTYLVQFAVDHQAEYLVRGIRNDHDLVYEQQMQFMNRGINGTVETVYLIPPGDLANISSSMVKSLIGPKGWEKEVARYLHPTVCEMLISKYSQRRVTK